MKSMARLVPVVLLAACGGAQTLYTSVTQSRIGDTVDCAADAIRDEGFQVTDRNDDSGLLRAGFGTSFDDADESDTWLSMKLIPDGQGYYRIEVETSDDDVARDAASEIVTECGTGM